MHRWAGAFDFFDEVQVAVSGETGVVIGLIAGNRYLVRYRRADGVAVEAVWAADALVPARKAPQVVPLKAVS